MTAAGGETSDPPARHGPAPALELRHVSKHYPGTPPVTALDGVSMLDGRLNSVDGDRVGAP